MMCVLFAVYNQDIFLEPAEGVKQAVKEHKLQFLYSATAFVKKRKKKKKGLPMLSMFYNRND